MIRKPAINVKRAMGPLPLALTVFCAVSGGPFGLEPLVQQSGAGLALVLIVLMPFLWALPDSLTTCELAPAIPVEGGYVVWVRRAMGPFAGFLNAWWTWIYALIDAAIYPVLFAEYLSSFLQGFFGIHLLEGNKPLQWAAAMGVIAAFTFLNIRGTKLVGWTSSAFAVALIVPFFVMGVIGLFRLAVDPRPVVQSFLPPNQSLQGALASGLALAMWNYLGWDSLSTIAEEVENPERAYPRALLIGVPLVTLVYLLPTLTGLAFFGKPEQWEEGMWPQIASAVGGSWLGVVVTVIALISPVALFTASLLGASRIPFVLAEEGFMPKALVSVHPRFGTPWRAILFCGVIYAVLAATFTFRKLVELNVIMYSAALCLESAALLVLRYKEPDLPRPFRVPGGWPVLILVFLLPVSVAALLVVMSIKEEGWQAQRLNAILLLSGPAVYALIRLWRRVVRQPS